MAKLSNVLYNKIHERADTLKEGWPDPEDRYYEAARQLAKEAEAEGLSQTAEWFRKESER